MIEIARPVEGTLRPALNQVLDGASIAIEPFQHFPLVIDRLAQLKSALDLSPPEGLALEFGVFKGVSLRALALACAIISGKRMMAAFTGTGIQRSFATSWRPNGAIPKIRSISFRNSAGRRPV